MAITTHALGEEDGYSIAAAPGATTDAIGEEDNGDLAAAPSTAATGEEEPQPTTMRTGEEESAGTYGGGVLDPFGSF